MSEEEILELAKKHDLFQTDSFLAFCRTLQRISHNAAIEKAAALFNKSSESSLLGEVRHAAMQDILSLKEPT